MGLAAVLLLPLVSVLLVHQALVHQALLVLVLVGPWPWTRPRARGVRGSRRSPFQATSLAGFGFVFLWQSQSLSPLQAHPRSRSPPQPQLIAMALVPMLRHALPPLPIPAAQPLSRTATWSHITSLLTCATRWGLRW